MPALRLPKRRGQLQGSGGFGKPRDLSLTAPAALGPAQFRGAGRRAAGPDTPFLLYTLTSYLHRIQLAAFLREVHLPEGAPANGLHYVEFLNGGRSRHRNPLHAIPCRRASPALRLSPRGGLHRSEAQRGPRSRRPGPLAEPKFHPTGFKGRPRPHRPPTGRSRARRAQPSAAPPVTSPS